MNKLKQKIGIIILGIVIFCAPTFSFATDYATGQAGLTPASSLGTLNAPQSILGSQVTPQAIDLGQQVQLTTQGATQPSPIQGGQPASSVNQASQSGFSLVSNCIDGKVISGSSEMECGWKDLVTLAKNIMYYLIFIGTTLAALSLAYAGFMYATSAGNSGKIEKAHHIFTTVAIGLLFLWGGWLLVATLMSTLGVKSEYSLVNNTNVQPVNKTTTGN